jgi:oligopeptide transport system substrate-binding protein
MNCKKRIRQVLIFLVLASLLLVACTQPGQETVERVETVVVTEIVEGEIIEVVKTVIVEVLATPGATEEEIPVTLNWNIGTDPPTIDPALATDTTSLDVIGNLFVSLTKFDPVSGEVEPYLATSWSSDKNDEGNPVWTFTLRDDIPWVHYDPLTGEVTQVMDEEGRPRFVNALDVEYGVKRTIDPATASDYAYVLYVIKDAALINQGEDGYTIDNLGVKALDGNTIQFTLEYDAAYFPSIAGLWVANPVPHWTIEEWENKWTEAGLINTNGPYLLESWIHGGELNLVKNPVWVEADRVQIERVEGLMIGEASTAFALYESNELDTVTVPLREIDRIKTDPVLGQEFFNAPTPCTMYIGYTNNKPPLDDVRVRRAFTQAIDRQSLIDNILKGGQIPATSFAPPGTFGAPLPGEVGLHYDPEAARTSLQEYLDEKNMGIDEFNDLGINSMYFTGESMEYLSAALQQMWQDTLGVEVEFENQEWKVYLDTISSSTPLEDMPNIWGLGWCADYADENNWVHEVFNAFQGPNSLRRNCLDPNCEEVFASEFDELTTAAALEKNPAKRAEMYREAERILSEEEAAYAPLYHAAFVIVTKPWLQRNYPLLSGVDFYNWTIDMQAKLTAQGK